MNKKYIPWRNILIFYCEIKFKVYVKQIFMYKASKLNNKLLASKINKVYVKQMFMYKASKLNNDEFNLEITKTVL